MRSLCPVILSLLVLCGTGTRAWAQASNARPTIIVVPPPAADDPDAPTGQQPPTSVVVVPPPPDYKPDPAPPSTVTERDESRYGYYPPPQARPRYKTGMLTTGIVLLGASYAVSFTVGMSFAGGSCKKCQDIGIPLLVPVAGPFFAASNVKDGRGALIFLGIPQVIGAALAIGGYYRYRNSKMRAREDGFVVELRHGKSLALDVAASPALVGPRMNLRF